MRVTGRWQKKFDILLLQFLYVFDIHSCNLPLPFPLIWEAPFGGDSTKTSSDFAACSIFFAWRYEKKSMRNLTRPDTRQKMRLVCVLFTFENNTGRTYGPTDGRTRPLIEMRRRIQKPIPPPPDKNPNVNGKRIRMRVFSTWHFQSDKLYRFPFGGYQLPPGFLSGFVACFGLGWDGSGWRSRRGFLSSPGPGATGWICSLDFFFAWIDPIVGLQCQQFCKKNEVNIFTLSTEKRWGCMTTKAFRNSVI